eukprot:1156465-Pelagomonas_calceolata.AAC.1
MPYGLPQSENPLYGAGGQAGIHVTHTRARTHAQWHTIAGTGMQGARLKLCMLHRDSACIPALLNGKELDMLNFHLGSKSARNGAALLNI